MEKGISRDIVPTLDKRIIIGNVTSYEPQVRLLVVLFVIIYSRVRSYTSMLLSELFFVCLCVDLCIWRLLEQLCLLELLLGAEQRPLQLLDLTLLFGNSLSKR